MKKIIIILVLALFTISQAQANPLTKKQKELLKDNKTLVPQMKTMLESVSNLDTIVNHQERYDFKVFEKDSKKILSQIKKMKEIDEKGIFKTDLDKLETAAQKLNQLSMAKDPKSVMATQELVNTCFKCHKANRNRPGLE